jgi:hypothetical protein
MLTLMTNKKKGSGREFGVKPLPPKGWPESEGLAAKAARKAYDARHLPSVISIGAEEGDGLLTSAAVDIFETHDIVLSQVVAALDLNQHQVYDTGVGQTVRVAGTNERRLVGV